jgi:hypothetical protein
MGRKLIAKYLRVICVKWLVGEEESLDSQGTYGEAG